MFRLAVDPSLTESGVCWRTSCSCHEKFSSGVVPIEEAGLFLEGFSRCHDRIAVIVELPERGRGRRNGFTFSMAPVKSAVRCWKDAVRRRWPRKNSIVECRPHEWRAIIFGPRRRRSPIESTKDNSRLISGVDNHNEADAICLMQYFDFLETNQ